MIQTGIQSSHQKSNLTNLIHREIIMNMLAKFGCAGVMALSFAGAVQAEGALNLYNWGDYINPGILKKFTPVSSRNLPKKPVLR